MSAGQYVNIIISSHGGFNRSSPAVQINRLGHYFVRTFEYDDEGCTSFSPEDVEDCDEWGGPMEDDFRDFFPNYFLYNHGDGTTGFMYDCQTKKKFDTTLLAGKEATFEGALIFIDNYIRDKYRDVPISGVIIHCHFCVPYILSFKRELDEHRRRREAEEAGRRQVEFILRKKREQQYNIVNLFIYLYIYLI